ncbi:uncharacterized protein LOC141967273 isoform X3 [Athene noctua]|uniref:uncharacterized protein LOC141967273 isoform X3 n=1 Tax=Athene noctua TaxID=126797 RepID=UPI003EBD55E6
MDERGAMAEQERGADSPSEFNVFIKTLSGKTFGIPVSLDTSVRELKDKLNAQDPSLLPEAGRLIYASTQLEDDQTLRYYRVKPESSLYHLRRLRGGGAGLEVPGEISQGEVGLIAVEEMWLHEGGSSRSDARDNPRCFGGLHRVPGSALGSRRLPVLHHRPRLRGEFSSDHHLRIRHLEQSPERGWPGNVGARWTPLPHRGAARGRGGSAPPSLHLPGRRCGYQPVLHCPLQIWADGPGEASQSDFFLCCPGEAELLTAWCALEEAIEEQENSWNSKFIPKPPPCNQLFFGCTYRVASTNSVEIMPEAHFPFCYKSPKEQQLFLEIYIKDMAEEVGLLMTDTRDDTVVWRASLRPGDIAVPASASKALSGAAFMKKHKTKLCSRMMQLSTILLHLRDANVINSDEEEEVYSQGMRQRKNQFLLELVEKKGLEAQEQLYQVLLRKDPCLISDLEKCTS